MTIRFKGIEVLVNEQGFRILSSKMFFKTLEELNAFLSPKEIL